MKRRTVRIHRNSPFISVCVILPGSEYRSYINFCTMSDAEVFVAEMRDTRICAAIVV